MSTAKHQDGNRDQLSWKTLIPWRRKPSYSYDIPIEDVGLFSFLTYTWLDSFMWTAFRFGIDGDKLWKCPRKDAAQHNADRLETLWREELQSKGPDHVSLARVFLRFVKCRLLVSVFIMLVSVVLLLLGVAYLMMSVLKFSGDMQRPQWEGIVLVISLFVVNMLNALFFVSVFTIMTTAGARLRGGVVLMLYNKLLRALTINDRTVGQVLNLFANDSQRIFDGVSYLPMLLAAPVLSVGATAYAIYLLGWWPIIGFVILCLLLPLQALTGKAIVRLHSKSITITDKRVRLIHEMLSQAKFTKMYAWEKPLSKIVTDIRSQEKNILEKENLAMSLGFLSSVVLVSIATMSTLMIYTLAGNTLSAVEAFTYLLVYNLIREKLALSILAIRTFSELRVAARRFQSILLLGEDYQRLPLVAESMVKDDSDYAVQVVKATLSWPDVRTHVNKAANGKAVSAKDTNGDTKLEDATELHNLRTPEQPDADAEHVVMEVLRDLNIRIEKGDVVGIVGTVGSGKSALISALLGQLRLLEGEVVIHGTLAYVPQQPWIFNASVRENILLGQQYDDKRYAHVIEACCLLPDMDILPAGDLTEIGERGVTVSGGQKQRISLARALYSDRDIYLLDDPFSAVDPDVGDLIYQNVVQGCLVGKTILMVTHELKYFPDCDYVIHLKNGQIVEQGTHTDLMDAGGEYSDFTSTIIIRSKGANFQFEEYDDTAQSADAHVALSPEIEEDEDMSTPSPHSLRPRLSRVFSIPGKRLMTQEERETGVVGWQTYKAYIQSAGGAAAMAGIVFISLLAEGCRAFGFWWLGKWISDSEQNVTVVKDNVTYVTQGVVSYKAHYHFVYGITLLAILVCYTLRSIALIKVLMHASSTMHNALFEKIFRSPMKFFDTTPLGRIINRFSKDMDELDSRLPPWIDNTMRTIIGILIYLTMIGVIIYWFLIAVIPVAAIFLFCYVIFRVGVRDLKRLQNISMSPLLSHVTGTLQGLASVHAYDKEEDFREKFINLLNYNTVTLLLFHFCTRWINVRLSVLVTAIVCITALSVVLLRGSIEPAFAGVAMLYAAQLTHLFQYFVKSAVETEARFTCVERVNSYIQNLESEGPRSTHIDKSIKEWPTEGQIKFVNYDLRYRQDLPLVLKDIVCSITAHEKIGIVGRTGSGKSSLATALFRLVEPSKGRIEIDGVDIELLGLQELRSKMSIIPQDPVVFAGTIRSNLDPFQRHIDHELWRALDKCHLKETVDNLEGKLDHQIVENGNNLSVGEKQLVCMARVLLRHSKIVILDEATASIDTETEDLIRNALAEAFKDCTLLIIAHRLQTVIECDRVMVMDDGKIIEFDQPSVLLADPDSRFSHMMAVSLDPPGGLSTESLDAADVEAWV